MHDIITIDRTTAKALGYASVAALCSMINVDPWRRARGRRSVDPIADYDRAVAIAR